MGRIDAYEPHGKTGNIVELSKHPRNIIVIQWHGAMGKHIIIIIIIRISHCRRPCLKHAADACGSCNALLKTWVCVLHRPLQMTGHFFGPRVVARSWWHRAGSVDGDTQAHDHMRGVHDTSLHCLHFPRERSRRRSRLHVHVFFHQLR